MQYVLWNSLVHLGPRALRGWLARLRHAHSRSHNVEKTSPLGMYDRESATRETRLAPLSVDVVARNRQSHAMPTSGGGYFYSARDRAVGRPAPLHPSRQERL